MKSVGCALVWLTPALAWIVGPSTNNYVLWTKTQRLSSTDAGSDGTTTIPYNWKDQWYALTYASYVPDPARSAETTPAAVFGHPLVLWRESSSNSTKIYCADDVCPHRAAALSEGRVRNNTIQCLYHGWSFSGFQNGACTRIPQLDKTATIPKRACLNMRPIQISEDLVWVWMGDSPPNRDPPSTGVLDVNGKAKGWSVYDFMIDLPYDHSYLVENLLDPAHVDISHDRTPGGGKRENAQAYDMQVDQDSMNTQGFTGRFRFAAMTDRPYTNFTFEAPGIVRNQFAGTLRGRHIQFGAALHCMPLSLGRSRLFFRVYNSGFPWIINLLVNKRPKWLRHLNSCKILEQDVGLITTQEDHFKRNLDRSLWQDYLLIKSSDAFVEAYRKWLDRVGHGMPWFQGLVHSAGNPYQHISDSVIPPGLSVATHRSSNDDISETRYHRHVIHSHISRNAMRNVQLLKSLFAGFSGVALVTSLSLIPSMIVTVPPVTTQRLFKAMVSLLPVSTIFALALQKLEKKFHVSFKRKDQLRTDSGLVS